MTYLVSRTCSLFLTSLLRLACARPVVWQLLAGSYWSGLDRVARWQAAATCRIAAVEVPAYQDFLGGNRARRLAEFPETAKSTYAGCYTEESRCRGGRVDPAGTVVDESSGSSGKPYNWLRGREELSGICRNVAGYTRLMFPGGSQYGPLFVINAYSMGAWATGTTTGAAMARIAIVKNTGPDPGKIADTLRHFGPGYRYLITAYPPFLKHLRDELDADGFDWRGYRIDAMVGGEGITEALRDYLQERFGMVRSGYGASDLTIGIGAESAFTVWLRRRLRTDRELRAELLGTHEQRLPMIFHYNPLETYLEVNDRSELLCTVSGTSCLQPKLRYNVGDEATLSTLPKVMELIARDPRRKAQGQQVARGERITLPLLFLYGRKDSTVSYMGANLYPQDVEYGLYQGNPYAARIAAFCLSLEEQPGLEYRPTVSIELRAALGEAERADLALACQRGVLGHLAHVSRDFAEALREDPTAADVRIRVFGPGEGPFRRPAGSTLKNKYLVSQA
ncbi:MAG TPA: phenylacetate--CoA ligase family protein [Trebonia sp.]|nr:phenylacetate--CoA ligase family protein [Trebonia sp.]